MSHAIAAGNGRQAAQPLPRHAQPGRARPRRGDRQVRRRRGGRVLGRADRAARRRRARGARPAMRCGRRARSSATASSPALPPIGKTRVGLHCGEAVVGNFGGKSRIQYTALGDSMNTAARLEAANKALDSSVMASREFAERSGLDWWRPMGRVVLRGRSKPVDLFEPAPDFPAEDRAALYQAMILIETDRAAALEVIAALADKYPDDAALANLLERTRNLSTTTPSCSADRTAHGFFTDNAARSLIGPARSMNREESTCPCRRKRLAARPRSRRRLAPCAGRRFGGRRGRRRAALRPAAYPVGKKIGDSERIVLRAGDTLTVLDGNGTRVLRGAGTYSLDQQAGAEPAQHVRGADRAPLGAAGAHRRGARRRRRHAAAFAEPVVRRRRPAGHGLPRRHRARAAVAQRDRRRRDLSRCAPTAAASHTVTFADGDMLAPWDTPALAGHRRRELRASPARRRRRQRN